MKNKKRNIMIATFVCFVSLLIYIPVHFSTEEHLFEIGNHIESLLGISTTIQVSTMQSFITTICSGISASTLVTLFFYFQDYQREKQIQLQKTIKINNDICQYYKKIPYIEFATSDDFSNLAKAYYYEYYDNKLIEDLSKASADYLKTIPKSARRVLKVEAEKSLPKPKDDNKKALLAFIKENKRDISQSPESILRDIIQTLDYKIDKAVEVYKKILSVDLSELMDIYEDISVFCCYGMSTKRFIKKRIGDEKIYPYLFFKKTDMLKAQIKNTKRESSLYNKLLVWTLTKDALKCSTENTVGRIYTLQQRAQTYIEKIFEMHDFEELKKYNKRELLNCILILQHVLLDTNTMSIKDAGGNVLKNINYSYNKFVFYIENLNRLLLYDITQRYKYLGTECFAMKVDRYENGSHIHAKEFSGEDINPDIYRL